MAIGRPVSLLITSSAMAFVNVYVFGRFPIKESVHYNILRCKINMLEYFVISLAIIKQVDLLFMLRGHSIMMSMI